MLNRLTSTFECLACPTQLSKDWKYCPGCGWVIENAGRESPAVLYLQSAFESAEIASLAEALLSDKSLELAYLRYMLSILQDPKAAAFSRSLIIKLFTKMTGEPLNRSLLWYCLSRLTDKYFDEKASLYRWTLPQQKEISLRWYELMSELFLNLDECRSIALSIVEKWVADYLALHKFEVGPNFFCSSCTSACYFQYEVVRILQLDESVRAKLEGANGVHATFSDVVSWTATELVDDWISGCNADLSYCLVSHYVAERAKLSNDAKLVLLHRTRTCIDRVATGEIAFGYYCEKNASPETQEAPEEQDGSGLVAYTIKERIVPLVRPETTARESMLRVIAACAQVQPDKWKTLYAGSISTFAITDQEVQSEVSRLDSFGNKIERSLRQNSANERNDA